MLYSRGRAVKVWKLEMHKYLYPKFLPKHFRSPGQIHAGSSQSHCSCSPFQLLSLRHERSVQKLASKKRRRRRMACSSPVMVIMVLRSLFTPPRLTSAPFCVKLFSCRSPMTLVLLHSKPTLLSSTNQTFRMKRNYEIRKFALHYFNGSLVDTHKAVNEFLAVAVLFSFLFLVCLFPLTFVDTSSLSYHVESPQTSIPGSFPVSAIQMLLDSWHSCFQ